MSKSILIIIQLSKINFFIFSKTIFFAVVFIEYRDILLSVLNILCLDFQIILLKFQTLHLRFYCECLSVKCALLYKKMQCLSFKCAMRVYYMSHAILISQNEIVDV